ncbi:proline and alanine rich protein [Mycobacterium tuberculosis T46]|nr:proline and alanine rich protein [Mycobacterium tuberculosis T46]
MSWRPTTTSSSGRTKVWKLRTIWQRSRSSTPVLRFRRRPHRQTYRSPTARLRPRRPTTCRSGSCRPRRRHPHPHLRLRQLRCRSPQESRPRRNRPHLNHPHPPCPSPDPNRPHPNHPHLRCPSPDLHPPQPNPSWRPPDHRHHKRQPERRSNRNHRRPTYPRTGHINPGAPHQHRPGQRCQSANPRPLRPDRLRPRPNHRPGLPPNTPDVRAGGHRYRTDTERNVGKVATGPSIQARLRAEEASGAQLAPGTEPSPAPLGQPRSYLAPPTRPAPTEPPPSPSPQRNSGRRASDAVTPI